MIHQHEILEAAKEAGFSPNMSYTLLPMIDYVNFEASEIIKRFAAIIERRYSAGIEQLERKLAERDAEIAKYRDAPVVAWINKDHTFVQLSDKSTVYGSHTIPLIVKPGE